MASLRGLKKVIIIFSYFLLLHDGNLCLQYIEEFAAFEISPQMQIFNIKLYT